MLNASYFLVMHWVSWQGLILFYFSQAVSGISSSKPSCRTIYSYGGRSFHSGAQLQMDAIEKSLNFAAVQLRHQTPHAAQLFSLATASFKNLFFPDYASVGCLWRLAGVCWRKKEWAVTSVILQGPLQGKCCLILTYSHSLQKSPLIEREGKRKEDWGRPALSDLSLQRTKIKREKINIFFSLSLSFLFVLFFAEHFLVEKCNIALPCMLAKR